MAEATTWSDAVNIALLADAPNEANICAFGRSIHVIYAGTGGNVRYVRSLDEGSTWSSPTTIASGDPVLTGTICIEGSSIHIFYVRSNVLYHRRSLDNGTTWGSEDTIFTGSSGNFYRVASGVFGGIVHVVWVEHNSTTFAGTYLKYRRSLDNGTTWQTTVDPYSTASANSPGRPELCAINGSVHITWADLRGGGTVNVDDQIYVGRSLDNGATWQTEIALTSGVKQALRSAIWATSDAVICTWQQSNNGTTTATTLDIYLKRSTDNGASWGSVVQITSDSVIDEHPFIRGKGAFWSLIHTHDNGPSQGTRTVFSNDGGATWGSEKITGGGATGAPCCEITEYYAIVVETDISTTFINFERDPLVGPDNSTVLDNFNRADSGPPPSSSWENGIDTFGASDGIVIVSNQATQASTGTFRQGSYYRTPIAARNLFVGAEVSAAPNSSDGEGMSIWLRMRDMVAGAAQALYDAYQADISKNGSQTEWAINRYVNGAYQYTLADKFTGLLSVGDMLGFEANEDRLRTWYKPSGGAWRVIADVQDSPPVLYGDNDRGVVGIDIMGGTQNFKITNLFATPLSSPTNIVKNLSKLPKKVMVKRP